MPQTRFQRFIFALLSVILSVHCFVFYNLAMDYGFTNEIFTTAYSIQTAKALWGIPVPIILMEFIFALLLELFIGGPMSEKLAMKVVNPRENKPYMVITGVICATVALMCPMMSFVAAILYYVWAGHGPVAGFLVQWFHLICRNFPFAFFAQLFFIQPFVRFLFGKMFAQGNKAGHGMENHYA